MNAFYETYIGLMEEFIKGNGIMGNRMEKV